jgi:osmoprotectant transport system ATP-binding protein
MNTYPLWPNYCDGKNGSNLQGVIFFLSFRLMTEVELVGITKRYGDHLALHDVSVSFRKEKITAIVGRSGSGKSTLLKSINGLTLPSSGQVLISGQPLDYNSINTQRHKIGYVVQGNGLFPHITVSQNISLPGKITSKEDPSRVGELLKFVDLPVAYSTKYPNELSGGEQQRVAIARALYLNPPILLMDEPFGSLDTLTRRELYEKILELQKTFRLTMIIVTHDPDEASRLADDTLVIDKGRVQR